MVFGIKKNISIIKRQCVIMLCFIKSFCKRFLKNCLRYNALINNRSVCFISDAFIKAGSIVRSLDSSSSYSERNN